MIIFVIAKTTTIYFNNTYHKELRIKNNCINIHPKGRTPPIITPGIG